MLTLFQRPHIKHLATSLALALLPGLAHATSEVLIQSQQNGLYVCVSSGYLSAICPSDQAIRFEMEEFDDGTVAFRDLDSGQYMRIGDDSIHMITLGGDRIGLRQQFEREDWGNATYLRAQAVEAYLRAGLGAESHMAAASQDLAGWEAFSLIPVSGAPAAPAVDPVSGAFTIMSLRNPETGQPVPLDAIAPWERIARINADGSFFASLGCNNISGRFVLENGRYRTDGPIEAMLIACDGAGNRRDAVLANALQLVTDVTFDGRQLALFGGFSLLMEMEAF